MDVVPHWMGANIYMWNQCVFARWLRDKGSLFVFLKEKRGQLVLCCYQGFDKVADLLMQQCVPVKNTEVLVGTFTQDT